MSHSRLERKVQKQRRFRKFKRILITFGLLCFIFLGGGAGYFTYKAANITSGASQELERGEKSEKRVQAVSPSKDNISILFLGVDDRDETLSGRTDAMILATFNKEENTIKMLSIPRDSRVEIVGRDRYDKINHAHAFGGLDMTVDTVENLFDIPVDYYAKLNFQAFIEIVDSLDGIEIDVPFTFSEMDSSDNQGAITLYEGTQLLNGEEALAYARMRKLDPTGDIGRGERQQEIIAAIIRKGASISSITKYDDVLDSIGNHLATNLSFGNILSLHSYASSLTNIESLTLEGINGRINGIYYYELNETNVNEISTELKEHLGIQD
ncbi:LCP family protein [Anaerobacillus sp. MEB173]|uniref:LCP family glycopolymer transferase n=1 Tax=Anaerobacillus sp. MEB173 TaxID=3383345 RepID=UPI003F93704A